MITASVVLFNTSPELIQTITKSYQPSAERLLFFVDNSPAHDKNEHFVNYSDNIFIYHTGRNLGYGSAHNIAIHEAIRIHSEFHIVLNPDLSFNPQIIDSLVDYAKEHPDVVYMLPKVVDPHGEVQHLCKLLPTPSDLIFRRFFPWMPGATAKNDRYVLLDSGYDHIMNPPCLSGCFMFLRVSVIKKYELFFDEHFFMYCEDFDLMRRLHRIGKTIYYPYVQITHMHERSSYHSLKMMCHHIASAIKYFNKYGWWKDAERDRENSKILSEIKQEP